MTEPLNKSIPEERNLGSQPIAELLDRLHLSPHDLVAASPNQITHKLIQRAIKGRWQTRHSRRLVLQALQAASGRTFVLTELFNYE